MDAPKTVILGAGITGLTAGYDLTRNGYPVEVVERDPFHGGLARSVHKTTERGEFIFDIGGHRWLTRKPELQQFVVELMQGEMIDVPRKSRYFIGGRWVDYPLTVRSLWSAFSLFELFGFFLSYLAARIGGAVRRREIRTLYDFLCSRFGARLTDVLLGPYGQKVWGVHPSKISASWGSARIKRFSFYEAIKTTLFPSLRGQHATLIEQFIYPELGFGRICDRLVDGIEAQGSAVHLGVPVTRVALEGNRVVSVSTGGDEPLTVAGDWFISTIPVHALIAACDPPPPPEVQEAVGRLRYRDLICVNVMLSGEALTDDTWIYFPDPAIRFNRQMEPRNWSRKMAPDGTTSVTVELCCDRTDPIFTQPAEEIAELVIGQLEEKVGIIDRADVIDTQVIRITDEYPSYDLDYEHPLRTVLEWAGGIENLMLVGRTGRFRYINTDKCVEMGLNAAGVVQGRPYDFDAEERSTLFIG